MTKPMIRIHDIATDEVIDREMNAQELAQHEADQAAAQAQAAAQHEATAARKALLDRLGISEAEAKLLLS